MKELKQLTHVNKFITSLMSVAFTGIKAKAF